MGSANSAQRESDEATLVAAEHCDAEHLARLLDEGANPNQVGEGRTTPLLLAAQEGAAECVELLLAQPELT